MDEGQRPEGRLAWSLATTGGGPNGAGLEDLAGRRKTFGMFRLFIGGEPG